MSVWCSKLSVKDTYVMSGDLCWYVVLYTLITVSVFGVMCLELLIMLEINVPL